MLNPNSTGQPMAFEKAERLSISVIVSEFAGVDAVREPPAHKTSSLELPPSLKTPGPRFFIIWINTVLPEFRKLGAFERIFVS